MSNQRTPSNHGPRMETDVSVTVATIVPAYNEASTIQLVVRTLVASPHINEVIVVSDGSTDATAERARKAGANVLELKERSGKGEALQSGVAHTKAQILLFVDADLIGFTTDHIEQLLEPVFSRDRMMNVGLRDRGGFFFAISKYLPLISGERAMCREVFEKVPPRFLHGFMVEVALNYWCRVKKHQYGAVPLYGLKIRHKYEKVGIWRGSWQYFKMWMHVLKAMVVVRVSS